MHEQEPLSVGTEWTSTQRKPRHSPTPVASIRSMMFASLDKVPSRVPRPLRSPVTGWCSPWTNRDPSAEHDHASRS